MQREAQASNDIGADDGAVAFKLGIEATAKESLDVTMTGGDKHIRALPRGIVRCLLCCMRFPFAASKPVLLRVVTRKGHEAIYERKPNEREEARTSPLRGCAFMEVPKL